MDYTQVALSMHKNNIIAIPVQESKISVFLNWGKLHFKTNSPSKIVTRFAADHFGIAMVTGRASDNLEAINIDCYNMPDTYLADDVGLHIMKKIKSCPLLSMIIFCMIKTPRGGYHLIYRCSEIGPCLRIAGSNEKPTISVKGEKGYIVTYPTPGYLALQIQEIPVISPIQRNMLFSILRAYNRL